MSSIAENLQSNKKKSNTRIKLRIGHKHDKTVVLRDIGIGLATFLLSALGITILGWAVFTGGFLASSLPLVILVVIVLVVWFAVTRKSFWTRGIVVGILLVLAAIFGPQIAHSAWFANVDWIAFLKGLLLIAVVVGNILLVRLRRKLEK